MELRITVRNNYYKLIGALKDENVLFFKERIAEALQSLETLTIDIDEVQAIDAKGVEALKELHNLAMDQQKKLSIIGLGCKELYDHFNTSEAA